MRTGSTSNGCWRGVGEGRENVHDSCPAEDPGMADPIPAKARNLGQRSGHAARPTGLSAIPDREWRTNLRPRHANGWRGAVGRRERHLPRAPSWPSYMLRWETKGSATLLNVAALERNADGEDVAVDLPETIRDGREAVVIWRNTEGWTPEDRERESRLRGPPRPHGRRGTTSG